MCGDKIERFEREASARLSARVRRLEKALREIQLHAAEPLRAENRPGYELREFCEEVHAMAASALSSGSEEDARDQLPQYPPSPRPWM